MVRYIDADALIEKLNKVLELNAREPNQNEIAQAVVKAELLYAIEVIKHEADNNSVDVINIFNNHPKFKFLKELSKFERRLP